MAHPIDVLSSAAPTDETRLRVAAISFLNPAPLMWDFEHAPRADELATRYQLATMRPAECADALLAGRAGLGLIPIAALTPAMRIVPGCTIASLDEVRSIQLIVRGGLALDQVRTVAADIASRSSLAYTEILFRHFLGSSPKMLAAPADPIAMLAQADAALLIGDPALLALERRAEIEAAAGLCTWIDIASLWRESTGLPWVAAVWAVLPEALAATNISAAQLTDDLNRSREAGLAHIDDLVREWTPRIAVPTAVMRDYLTLNIHYTLDDACLESILCMRRLAAGINILPELSKLPMLLR
jgi:chorismate dehydratase